MKIKIFLICLLTCILISSLAFHKTSKAIFESNAYKEGVYDITDIAQIKANAMLITPDTATSLIIIDPNGNQIFYKKFDTVNEIVNLGTILDDDRIAIIGKGEIAITIDK